MSTSKQEPDRSHLLSAMLEGSAQEWTDAGEAMHREPVAAIAVSAEPPGWLELAQGRESAPGRWARIVRRTGASLPVLEIRQGNVRWMRLLLNVYLLYLQTKAPPRVTREDDLQDLNDLLACLGFDERDKRDERLEVLCSTSQLFTLRDAILCCKWLICDLLPICPEQSALLNPLSSLRADLEKLLDRVLE